jgi:asparagine synthase (glutamine-hydrolysing)
VTVALTGDGGDESFAGYERYWAMRLAGHAGHLPAGTLARAVRTLPGARGERRSSLFRAARFLDVAAAPAAERYGRVMEVFPAELRERLWDAEARPTWELLPAAGPGLVGLQLVDVTTYLPGDLLPKADIASMAHSLELRSPLLDHEVLALGLALPDGLKLRGREGKQGLRRAFANLLPPEVAGRGKAGFGVPLARWFREDLRDLAGDVLLVEDGLFRRDAVERLLAEHADGAADHGHRLWCLLMLALWRRAHLGAPIPA